MSRVYLFAALLAASAQIASAAHVDIVPYFTGKSVWYDYNEVPTALKTGSYDLTGGEGEMVDPDDRVLTGTAVNYATGPGWVSTIDPGWTAPGFDNFDDASDKYPAGTLPVAAIGSLSYNVVVDPQLGHNLTYWDGTGAPNFGPVPAGEVLQIDMGFGQEVTLDGTDTPLSGTNIRDSLTSGEFHQHWVQRLWGSESSDPSDMPTEGFYLFSVNAQVNASFGTLVSDPLYIVMAHGFEKYAFVNGEEILAPEMLAARNWVQSNLVAPEPSSLLLCVGAAFFYPSRRRRSRLGRAEESRGSE